MRTRLDEIVDRLFCDVGRYVDPAIIKGLASAACQEAFLHGVERTVKRAYVHGVYEIQPAPVEDPTNSWPYHERRKGQRRKGPRRPHFTECLGRRSGQDRRKL